MLRTIMEFHIQHISIDIVYFDEHFSHDFSINSSKMESHEKRNNSFTFCTLMDFTFVGKYSTLKRNWNIHRFESFELNAVRWHHFKVNQITFGT